MLQDRRGDAYLIMQDIGAPARDREGPHDGRGRAHHLLDRSRRDRAAASTATPRPAPAATRPASRSTASTCRSGAASSPRAATASSGSSRRSTTSRPARRRPATPTRPSGRCSGVLDVGVSLARLDAETAGFRWRTLAAAALAAALLGTFAWFFTRHHLIRPVAALVQATRRVARDQLELEIPVTWCGRARPPRRVLQRHDALARARRRATSTRSCTASSAQVEERTAALQRRAGPARPQREALLARQALRLDRPRDQQPARRHPHLREAHRAHARAGRARRGDAAASLVKHLLPRAARDGALQRHRPEPARLRARAAARAEGRAT